MTDLWFRFVYERGRDALDPAQGSSWAFTPTVGLGEYRLAVTPADWPLLAPGWLPSYLSIPVVDEDLIEISGAIGLLPHRTSQVFPIIACDG